jgi:hypothetical protein
MEAKAKPLTFVGVQEAGPAASSGLGLGLLDCKRNKHRQHVKANVSAPERCDQGGQPQQPTLCCWHSRFVPGVAFSPSQHSCSGTA